MDEYEPTTWNERWCMNIVETNGMNHNGQIWPRQWNEMWWMHACTCIEIKWKSVDGGCKNLMG